MKIVNSEQDTDKNYFSTPARGKNPGKNIKKSFRWKWQTENEDGKKHANENEN